MSLAVLICDQSDGVGVGLVQYSDKSAVAVSVVGVVPLVRRADGRSVTQFPANGFVRTMKSYGAVRPRGLEKLERTVLRDASEDMMARFDLPPKCDVYTPQDSSAPVVAHDLLYSI